MQINPVINLGEVITWLLGVAGFCFTFGKLIQKVTSISLEVNDHRDDFERHEQADIDRFENLNRNLTVLATHLGQGGD